MTIAITGSDGLTHNVDPQMVDLFFDGKSGTRISDAQWDEQQRRIRGEVPPATIPGEIRYPNDDEYAAGERA